MQENQNQSSPQTNTQQPVSSEAKPQITGTTPDTNQGSQQLQQNIEKAKQEQLRALKKKKQRKALFTGCMTLGCGTIVLIFFAFLIFVSQAKTGIDPLLQLFRIDEATLVNTLIDLTHVGFGIFTFITFIFTLIGLFKLGLAKKEDKETRKKALLWSFIGGFLFFVMIFLWVTAYVALSTKRVESVEPLQVIISNPENTIGLTAPLKIEFEADDINYDQRKYTLLSYTWDFGDGEKRNGKSIVHEYTRKGPQDGGYTLTLTISFKDNETGEIVKETHTKDVIFINERVKASFTMIPESGKTPLEVKFDANDSKDPDGEIVNYEWEVNDDDKFDDAAGETMTRTFDQTGQYKIKLRVTDDNGEFDVVTKTLEVFTAEKIIAVIEINNAEKDFYVGKNYTFSGENSKSPHGAIKNYQWNFGDNTPQETTRTVTHAFQEPGTYIIVLKVTDESGESGESTNEIKVNAAKLAPEAVITTTPSSDEGKNLEGILPFAVEFDASKSAASNNNIVDYQWDVDGNGSIDTHGKTIEYVYSKVGEYKVSLTVIDAQNLQDVASIIVLVKEQGLVADIKASPVSGEAPLKVTFDATGSRYTSGEIVSYEWDFADGTPLRIGESTIIHQYTDLGAYTAKVTVLSSDGGRASDTIQISVRAVALTACFEPNIAKGEKPLTVTFNPSCSRGTITSYAWDFGDGKISRERKPTHIFEDASVYDVTLEVTDNENVIDRFTEQVIVTGLKEKGN